MSDNQQPALLRFDSFELDLRTGELQNNGIRVRLQDKPTKLLILLASRCGRLVTRDEIQKALWRDSQFVEFDHAINTAIKKIREALGDDQPDRRLLETLPRKGYRFLGEVQVVREAGDPVVPVPAGSVLRTEEELEAEFTLPSKGARAVFLFIQVGYVAMYSAALYYVGDLERAFGRLGVNSMSVALPLVVVTAMSGVAVRLYLLSSVGLGHPAAGVKFKRLFPILLILDGFWAASPLLVAHRISFGLALVGAAGLAYLPFSQRTLMDSIYTD
jgi:DNA-binding winged helix-turn-helix (wHTH) protein